MSASRTILTLCPPLPDPCAAAPRASISGERLSRLTTAARLAYMRPAAALRVDDPTIVRTERLLLRPLRATDRAEFVRVLRVSRDHLSRFCPLHGVGPGGESDQAIFERQLQLSELALRTRRAWRRIGLTHDGRIAGSFCINDIQRGLEHSGELVVWISAECAGKGLGTEGVRATRDLAFADLPRGLGLHRLTALVAPANAVCRGLMRSCGFALRPECVPIEIILSGAPAPHDIYAAYAPLAEPARTAGGAFSDHRRLAKALAGILQTEAAAMLAV